MRNARGQFVKGSTEGFQKGHVGFLGNSERVKKLWTNKEYREHMINAHKGYKWTEEQRVNFSLATKGHKHTEEAKQKMGKMRKGIKAVIFGENHHWFGRNMSGANHPRWISNRTVALERRLLRNSKEWKIWRSEIFKRDNYTCQDCKEVGVYIEAHHIIPVRSDMGKRFNINNGITLCRPCHRKTMWKESNFVEKYSQIVLAH